MGATMTSYRLLVIGGVVGLGAVLSASCSAILGADFNVALAGAGGSGGGSSNVAATSSSGSGGGGTTGGTGGDPGCLPDNCPPETVSASEDNPFGIAASGDSVYWTSYGLTGTDGTISRSLINSPSGGSQVLAAGLVNPSQVAVSTEHVYWTSTAALGGVYCLPLGGGAMPRIVAEGQPGPIGILVDDASVYWTSSDGQVKSVSVGCSTVPPMSTIVATGLNTPALLAKKAGALFVTEYLDVGRLMRVDPGVNAPVQVQGNLSHPDGVVDRNTDICYATAVNDGGVYCSDLGVVVTHIADHQDTPAMLTVDRTDSTLYWANAGSGTIMKATLFGLGAKEVANGQMFPTGVVVAGSYVYWTNYAPKGKGGSVMRVRIH
jgi:hypothetical protein